MVTYEIRGNLLSDSENQAMLANSIKKNCIEKINNPELQDDVYNEVAANIEKRIYMEGETDCKAAETKVNTILSALGKTEKERKSVVIQMALESVNSVVNARDWINSSLRYLCCIADIVAARLIGREWLENTVGEKKVIVCESVIELFNASYFIPEIGWLDATDPIIKDFLKEGKKSKDGRTITVDRNKLVQTLDAASQNAVKRYEKFMEKYHKK